MSHHIAEMRFLIVVGCSPVGFRRGMHAPATGATGLEEEPAERWPILTAARSGPNVPDDTPGSALPTSADLLLLGIDAVAARSRTVLERLIELIVRNGLVRTDRSPRTDVRSDARLGDEGMEVLRGIGAGEPVGNGGGVPEAAEVDGEHAVAGGEQRDQAVECQPCLWESVHQQDRGTAAAR